MCWVARVCFGFAVMSGAGIATLEIAAGEQPAIEIEKQVSDDPSDRTDQRWHLSDKAITLAKATAVRGNRPDLWIASRRPKGLEDTGHLKIRMQYFVSALGADTQELLTKLNYLGRFAIDELLEGLESENPHCRKWCAVQLENCGEPALQPLIAIAQFDEVPFVRTAAIGALGNLQHPSAVPTLIELLDEDDVQIVNRTLFALNSISSPQAIKAIQEFANRTPREFRSHIADLLVAQYASSEVTISQHWPAEYMHVNQLCRDASTILGEGFTESQAEVLIEHLNDEHHVVARGCLRALGEVAWDDAVPNIVGCNADVSAKCRALAKIASPEAIDYLLEKLQGSSIRDREAALAALSDKAGRWAMPLLVELLDEPQLRVAEKPGIERPAANNYYSVKCGMWHLAQSHPWPAGHRAHAAIASTLSRSGLSVRSINIAYGETYEVDKEIAVFRIWWQEFGNDHLDYRDVPPPPLTSAYWFFST